MENNDLSNLSTTEQLQLVRAHKAAIVEDLDVNQVIPYLLENLVLSHDDKQRIEHEARVLFMLIMMLKVTLDESCFT